MPLSSVTAVRSKPSDPVSEAAPAGVSPQQAKHFARAARLGTLLDDAFRIPIIGRRVGWDAILGFIPFVGDWITGIFSGLMLLEAKRAGAPNGLLLRMLRNIAVDIGVGMVPVVGDLFDVAFKANRRNAALLRDYLKATN